MLALPCKISAGSEQKRTGTQLNREVFSLQKVSFEVDLRSTKSRENEIIYFITILCLADLGWQTTWGHFSATFILKGSWGLWDCTQSYELGGQDALPSHFSAKVNREEKCCSRQDVAKTSSA